ncbi:MAG: hypothetical protein V1816_01190 [Pseudomonadota bacterium]
MSVMKVAMMKTIAILILILGMSGSVHAGSTIASPWTVDETVDFLNELYPPWFTPVAFEANLMSCTYYSKITHDPINSTFVENGEFDITEYRRGFIPGEDDGAGVGSAMSDNYYHLIGDFRVTGPVTKAGVSIEQGAINLYLDLTPDNSSRDKDILIGSARHLVSGGVGASENPDAIGSYEDVYDDFTLTAEGRGYWKYLPSLVMNLSFHGDILTSVKDPDDPNSNDTTGAGGVHFPEAVSSNTGGGGGGGCFIGTTTENRSKP